MSISLAQEITRATTFQTNALINRDAHLTPTITNAERQAGKRMSTTRFMGRLRKLNPHLRALTFDQAPNTALLVLDLPDGTFQKLMPFENSEAMPEWSVMNVKKQFDINLGRYVDIPWDEKTRGWRTVLARLIRSKIIFKAQTEKAFGVGNRASWKALTGATDSTEGIL